MFKGLRTKIESEQKGQITVDSLDETHDRDLELSKGKNEVEPSLSGTTQDQSLPIFNQENPITVDIKEPVLEDKSSSTTKNELLNPSSVEQENEFINDALLQKVEKLENEIVTLNDKLKSVIDERDENADQNAQLYQLIEKLRRNLQSENEINTNLQQRLKELDIKLKEKDTLIASLKNQSSTGISIRNFDPSPTSEIDSQSSDRELLRKRVNDLQTQLSDKIRQLRINQQNINDIKKTLQKEMSDHSKTQDELVKLQNKFKQQSVCNTNDPTTLQNGNPYSDKESKTNHSTISDRYPEVSYSIPNDGSEDHREFATATPHLDVISNLSKSSASVDDFDSNDLQQNSFNKEVNLEYLRNVLFRYMTTTDTETSQHLIKALSVLMDFSPEQSAAVKSAMQVRSSWLRLK